MFCNLLPWCALVFACIYCVALYSKLKEKERDNIDTRRHQSNLIDTVRRNLSEAITKARSDARVFQETLDRSTLVQLALRRGLTASKEDAERLRALIDGYECDADLEGKRLAIYEPAKLPTEVEELQEGVMYAHWRIDVMNQLLDEMLPEPGSKRRAAKKPSAKKSARKTHA